MYLHRVYAQNFRAFGDGENGPILDWELNKGMNVLIGENDAGKTTIVDAIRQVLWTTSFEYVRLFEHDFHISGSNRAVTLIIEATLKDLSPEQEASVLEWLTYEPDGSRTLILNLQARLLPPQAKRRSRIDTLVRAGRNGTGPEIGAAVRDLVRTTYLRPLRDAESELKPGRLSRLSQILGAHTLIAEQEKSDFDKVNPSVVPTTLVGLMEHAQHHIGKHDVVKTVQKNINENYLQRMSFAGDDLMSEIRISGDLSLTLILERFELSLLPPGDMSSSERCARGLGYNNALFMATELVLLREGDELGLLLVEEPEAHLHPQLQARVMNLLEQHAKSGQRPVQVVMTTHSPSLAASAAIEFMTLVHKAKTYRLRPEDTRLARADYGFLHRFIDATKSNLFFARGVVIVEGPAEALLLPVIAEVVGLSFGRFGISVVNVGGVGLYHYARIFQRLKIDECIPIPVACITDRDIVPDVAKSYVSAPKKGKRFEGDYLPGEAAETVKRKVDRVEVVGAGNVKVFVADHWTLEYDLARAGLAELMYHAIQLAVKAHARGERLTEADEAATLAEAAISWVALKADSATSEALATTIYQPLYEGDASKAVAAQYAANLLQAGQYGTGQALLGRLPTYLKQSLLHLAGTPGIEVSDAGGAA
ncbi:ATP-dependent nuclease [Caballeronia sordidicola]|uniref:ATP-dependent nuclease n=1 Tax=Caballeronia sordidicola TaxID=196367 RepID=UPI0005591066|nr:AAA family ATPase [Caballeronia sordidicola]